MAKNQRHKLTYFSLDGKTYKQQSTGHVVEVEGTKQIEEAQRQIEQDGNQIPNALLPEEKTNPQTIEERLTEMEQRIERLDKQTIKIVGDVASTTVPVTLNGIRRKITHSAP